MKRMLTLSKFMDVAEERITRTLQAHGFDVKFERIERQRDSWRYCEFRRACVSYSISIYKQDITMTAGEHDEQLFECFLKREYVTAEVLIESFAGRLDRYLSGGLWEEPDENAPGPIARFFQKVLGRA